MRSTPARSVGGALLAAVLTITACQPAAGPGATGDESLLPSSQTPSRSGDTASATPSPAGGVAGRGSGTPAPGTTPTVKPTRTKPYADDAGVGAMARAYLKASPATRMIVEVDYVSGRAPSRAALDHMTAILRRDLAKPGGITVARDDEIASTGSNYTFDDIEALEQRYRDRYSSGDTAVMYLLYLDGELDDEPGALGVAYRASSAAIFIDRVRSAASALVLPAAIERAVVVHEAGHLLALVNIGYQSRHDHEDPQNKHHSRYRDSVMYWAVEDISVASILNGGPPDDFNRFDRDDLEQLRAS